MKYQLIFSLLFTSSTVAFVHPSQHRFRTSLQAERGDSKKAIEEALEASRKFGPQSKEARVAWDIVEEINASDNSVASKPGDPTAQVDLDTLSKIKHHVQVHPAKTKPIKLGTATPQEWMDMNRGTSSITDPVLKKALSNAELMTEWWGIQSKEAKLAWEAVEDILSNDQSEVIKGPINTGEDCLVELMDACEAMEELDKVLFHKESADVQVEKGFQ